MTDRVEETEGRETDEEEKEGREEATGREEREGTTRQGEREGKKEGTLEKREGRFRPKLPKNLTLASTTMAQLEKMWTRESCSRPQ